MKHMKKILQEGQAALGRSRVVHTRFGIWLPAGAALFLVVLLLNLSLTQFLLKGYLAQDGFAVPQGSLTALLRDQEKTESVELLSLDMGDAVYTRGLGANDYYIGEDKVRISSGYPMYTQSGQVLFFLDDGLKLVTEDWETLDTYEGLYLSDGVTFNADRSQADIARTMLVQVEGGYQVAQETTISSTMRDSVIPMNAVCAFEESSIVYYAYQTGGLVGNRMNIPSDASITIGGQSYGYLEFLEKLGIWEEENENPEPSVEPEPVPEAPPEQDKETGGHSETKPGAQQQPAEGELVVGPTEPQKPQDPEEGEKEEAGKKDEGEKTDPTGDKKPKPPSEVLEEPGAPIENPNATPGTPAPPAPPTDTNPEYKDPEVSFSDGLTPWVYTLSTTASISDPAHVLDGGVQIYVYKVAENGKESQAMRRAVSASGAVTLGQLEPDSKFHVVAIYSYHDKYNYPQKKELDLGMATTLPFDQVGSIVLSYYDETGVPVGGAPVEIFSRSLQMRDLVLSNVSNGMVTEDGGITTHPDTDPAKAETYINSFTVNAAAREGNTSSTLKMSAASLRLLREGYQLSHWETPEQLRTGTYYDYTVTMQDRYGNEFSITGTEGGRDPREGSGHTCKDAPSVQIRVPGSENVSGSTRIDVTWKNPDASPVGANDQSGAKMGNEIIAALYLVKQGDVVAPENAVALSGHTLAEPGNTVTGKFLPVTVNSDETVTTVSTSWVITNLPVLTNYTAGVLCGYYDCDDGKVHRDETLKETTDFLTASLSNLGSISYTAQVDQLTHQEGRLMFRMDKADIRLLKLLNTVTFTVEERSSGNSVGTITLNKSELSSAAITYSRDENGAIIGNEAVAAVKLHLNGEETARTAEMRLLWTNLPEKLEDGGTPANVWDFLLATSATTARDNCWLTMTLGSTLSEDGELTPPRLLNLVPKTAYVGRFTTKASQGGVEEDVTSGSSKPVYFTTLSQAATVYVQNAFISTDFIELYGVFFTDPDECIMPDNADRGGNNVAIRIVNTNGVQVAIKYINSQENYESVRISGLETDQEYTMYVSALRYSNGGTVEKMYDLPYDQPQDEENPTVYKFTTGESVVGDLALLSVSQLYQNADFSSSASLSLLSENDFYQGVWQDGNYLYYSTNYQDPESEDYGTDTSVLEAYLAQARQTELYYDTDETLKNTIENGTKYMANRPYTLYTSNQTWQQRQEDSWTSRFIKVAPGEQYVIYNTSRTDYFRISFYYKSVENGVEYLRSYGTLTADYFMQGNVFEVPSTAAGGTPASDQICYMRISGFYQRTRESMIFEKYDPTSTEGSPDLAQGVGMSEGMNLNQYNAVGYSKTYAYTDYIPVTSGSVYELKGRDPNIDLAKARQSNTGSNSYVLFYAKDYTFLGSYLVANQTALVKAPFGAAYCRFNVFMDQSEKDDSGNTIIKLNRDTLSMRLHKSAKQDEYMATLRLRLSDQSDPEKQLLKPGGTYTVTLYTTTSSVTDSDDLEKQAYTELGVKTVTVTEADVDQDKLNLVDVQTFDGLTPNMGFKAVLSIQPESWNGGSVVLDTVYFTSNRVVHTISNLEGLLSMRNDPAGSYIVTADIPDVTSAILGADRPFTGTIDFQGHSVTTTSFESLFSVVSGSGVVKNLVLNYQPSNAVAATSVKSGYGTVATTNRGTLQNIIVHYAPNNNGYGLDMQYAGGICRYNYGTIDGFVVQFMKDIKVSLYFGGICSENRGTISNGYVCGAEILDEQTYAKRDARLVHVWKENGVVLSNNTQRIACGVGYNSPQATVSNVFVLGDLVVHSDDASTDYSNADYKSGSGYTNPYYETSVSNTATAAILVGENQGQVMNCFTTGDRRDYDPDENRWSFMLDRGPAIGHVAGQFSAENVTYFSPEEAIYSQESKVSANIANFNIRGEFESLYDYQWYENVLGGDGNRFEIRQRIDEGYYPKLILPSCFLPGAQPDLALPRLNAPKVEVLYNEVRLQGVDAALVTVSLNYPDWESKPVTGFTIAGTSGELECEVLAQRAVEDTYRVDILVTQGDANADSSYTIRGVTLGSDLTQEYVSMDGTDAGAREIKASFWQEISSIEDWKSYITSSTRSITGNYLLTEDLDFSQCTNGIDWYCSQGFYGTLNGGIYLEREEKLTTDAGEEIMQNGVVRTITVWGDLVGLHQISGIGNMGKTDAEADWTYMADRDKLNRSNKVEVRSLFNYLYGTLENLVFRDFHSILPATNNWSNDHAGVVRYARAGSRLENCHVRDSEFYSLQYAGALTAEASGATIRNCSARYVLVSTYRLDPNSTHTVNVGGLAGYVTSGIVSSCFAADVQIKVPDVYAANGVGGLVGYLYSTVTEDCYSTGTIDAFVGRVGGIAGQMTGESVMSGCWSTMSVMTVADYAGGIVGYHAGGQLINNFTGSTIISRSLATSALHRICSNPNFDENNRRDNYAYKGQYLTYTDPNPREGESMYQFGIWSENDGASGLLDADELAKASVWSSMIGVGVSYDLTGSGKTAIGLITQGGQGVQSGYMPKLMDADSGYLLYDQPNVPIGQSDSSHLGNVATSPGTGTEEAFFATVTLYNDREDLLTAQNLEDLLDARGITVIGGEVDIPADWDQGVYTADGKTGRRIKLKIRYGASGGSDGHYLDSYILSVPVYGTQGSTISERVQVRISLSAPVYKDIYTMDDWDAFFGNPQFATAYENIRLAKRTDIDAIFDFTGEHKTNVRVNRLSGGSFTLVEGGVTKTKFPTIKGDVWFNANNMSLINQVVTEFSNLNVEGLILHGTKQGTETVLSGNYKGVAGQIHGNIRNVNFTDVQVDGGSGSYVGMVGVLYGEASNINLKNIEVTTTSGSYVGGLTGWSETASNLKNITLTADDGGYNTVTSATGEQVGGLVGRMNGLANDQLEMEDGYKVFEDREPHLIVEQTKVTGRAYVGGIAGYAYSDGGRPDDFKIVNARVGKVMADHTTPGVTVKPDVTVTLESTSASAMRYVGGAVGEGNGRSLANIKVYNALVQVPEKSGNDTVTDDETNDNSYTYYAGGVTGSGGGGLRNSLAQNCTVITYGGYAGGLSGNSSSEYNRVRDCVVGAVSINATHVGGIIGYGYTNRSVVEHSVIFGGKKVGGAISETSNSDIRQNGVVDCLVVGQENVGGFAGMLYCHNNSSNYVTGSLNEDGTKSISTTVTDAILRQGADAYGTLVPDSYQGTEVQGDTNVGGYAGLSVALNTHDSYVSSGVKVTGGTNVGGLMGQYYGWYGNWYLTNERYIYSCAMGAEVIGTDTNAKVGGIIGNYAQYDESGNRVTTKEGPRPNRFYGLLVTGSVRTPDGGTAHILMPGLGSEYRAYDWNDTSGRTGFGFGYSRIYKGSTVNGNPVTGFGSFEDWRTPVYANRTNDYRETLTVTAETLTDRNMYFTGRDKTYGGMGWSMGYWEDDALQAMYPQQTEPASFAAYSEGISKAVAPGGDQRLVLWLDARNNTGEGYTDESSLVWKDLSNKHNDATLYWNNKTGKDTAYTIGERTTVMRWNEGSLEFLTGTADYYAQMKDSLSPYLNTSDGFTVELIYTYVTPEHTNNNSILSWKNGTIRGGFHGYYSPTGKNDYAYIHYGINSAGNGSVNTSVSGVKNYSDQYLRSAAYVFDGVNVLSYYLDGQLIATNTNASAMLGNFPTGDDTQWRIGYGAYTNAFLRICGVRVYSTNLSQTQLAQNAKYDQWYYFGGEKPVDETIAVTDSSNGNIIGAQEQSHTLTWNESTLAISGGSGSYKLFRSEDGSYNGTLVCDNYQSGQGLGSRGYYYVTSGSGASVQYSNVIQKLGTGYGPRLRSVAIGNEYYGTPQYFYVFGQEGRNSAGEMYNVDDRLYYGGYALPTAATVDRSGRNAPVSGISLFSMMNSELPEVTAYASGADRVNLELLSDAPEGLTYEIFGSEDPGATDVPVLSGSWPEDSRTLTMTWDYATPFTLRLTLGEESGDHTWMYNDLARTVMTYGSGFWYLYGSECYNAAGESLDENRVFLHMMNGLLLDEGGNLWNAADMSAAGSVTPFCLCPAQPVWSGTISEVQVDSYGTYLRAGDRLQATQMVAKGSQAYTMPAGNTVVGCFVTDTYLEQLYTTVLGTDGKLCDLGTALAYPAVFANSGIREISNSLGYTGNVVLVRYYSGKLVAFNYLSGELMAVKSQEAQTLSLIDFFRESFGSFGSQSLLSGGAMQAQNALTYEKEVAGNPLLQSALAALGSNESNTVITDGQGTGLNEAGLPGGQDGNAGPGLDTDQGSTPTQGSDIGVIEGEGTVSDTLPGENGDTPVNGEGGQDGDGQGLPTGPVGENDAAVGAETSGAGETPDENAVPGAEEPTNHPENANNGENANSQGGNGTETVDGKDPSGEPGMPGESVAGGAATVPVVPGAQQITTRYVAIYDSETGESAIYDLEEYLTKPEEELVSQNQLAQELAERGFTTTLSRSVEPPEVSANGLLLILFTGVGAVALLACMGLLKKRKLDRKEEK